MVRKKRKIKLLTKTTAIYLVFTFVAFFLSALFLNNEAEEYIDRELEERFSWTEKKISRDITRHGKLKRKRSFIGITQVQKLPNSPEFPLYSDTLIQNDESERKLLYRKKITYTNIDGKIYKLELLQNITDFNKLQEDIFEGLIPAFLILAIVIVLFNSFLSGYLFTPFNRILKQMQSYKVGKGGKVSTTPTNTFEFSTMQDLFYKMIKRTEKEYETLKEYTENMAHEIQTPISVLRNKTENFISDDNVMNNHAASVKTIYAEINHLSRLGTSLNLLTKVEHGEFNNIREMKTRDVIIRQVESISELANLRGLSFELDLSYDHALIIDPILLDVILKNLLSNSINYGTNDRPISVITNKNGLVISNSGPPTKFSENSIFSRFSKENESSASIGLGLAIVYKICQNNGLLIEYDFLENMHQFSIKENHQ